MTCTVSKNWLLGGYSAQFSLNTQLDAIALSRTTHRLLLAVKELIGDHTLPVEFKNLKGRDPSRVLIHDLSAPHEEEILTVRGSICTSSEDHGDFRWSPFHVSLVSRFSRFEGARTIIHVVEERRSDSLPLWLPWWILGAAAPIRIEFARFGFERFTSVFSVSRFGFMPVVSDSLLLDLAEGTLAISLTTDQPRWRPCNPFRDIPLFTTLSAALRSAVLEPLEDHFARELAGAAVFRG